MSSENELNDERRPAEDEEDGEGEDAYEIIRSPGVQENHYWNVAVRKLGELDISRRPAYQQIGIGGVTGWCIGNVFKKVGKVTALAVGGGLLILQVSCLAQAGPKLICVLHFAILIMFVFLLIFQFLLKLASQSGYVSINWEKINKDVGKVSKDINKKFEQYSTQDHQSKIAKYLKKGGEVVQKNIIVTTGFAGGFLLGLAS